MLDFADNVFCIFYISHTHYPENQMNIKREQRILRYTSMFNVKKKNPTLQIFNKKVGNINTEIWMPLMLSITLT